MSLLQLHQEIMSHAGCQWAKPIDDIDACPRITFIFDEAQNIPGDTLDTLRHLNDSTPYRDQVKVGLLFVGNHEFSLDVDAKGKQAMLGAFKDRVLHNRRFLYDDISKDDLSNFASLHGVADPDARAMVVRAFLQGRASRSFRRVSDFIQDLKDEARGGAITADIVAAVLDAG